MIKLLDIFTWDGEFSQRAYLLFWVALVVISVAAVGTFYMLPQVLESWVRENQFSYYFGMYAVFVLSVFATIAAVVKRMNRIGMDAPDRATVFLIPINVIAFSLLLQFLLNFFGAPQIIGDSVWMLGRAIVGLMILGALGFAFYLFGVRDKRGAV